MRFLFVMDPAGKMLPDKDTSFALMRGAQARGHESLHCVPRDVFLVGREAFATVRPIRVSQAAPHVSLGEREVVALGSLQAVLVRKDPPFDVAYLHLTQQLELVRDATLVVNDPRGLRDANEKLYALRFAHLMPRSIVTADPVRISDFVAERGGRAVIKSLDTAGGTGVASLATGDDNARAIVDIMTGEGERQVLVQEFLPAVRAGDKRVMLLDGKPLGAILRVPRRDDFRANIHVGGHVQPTTLTAAELAIVEQVGPELSRAGLWLVGLDLIGERLIEINVTSPTGIQEIGRLASSRPEEQVIAWIEERAAARSLAS
jgi:glutathione synthase